MFGKLSTEFAEFGCNLFSSSLAPGSSSIEQRLPEHFLGIAYRFYALRFRKIEAFRTVWPSGNPSDCVFIDQ